MQLLRITSTPMKYELEVERPQLEYQQDVTPSEETTTTPSKLSIHSKNTQVQINTYEARKSLGCMTMDDRSRQYAEKGKEHITKLMRDDVEMGKEMSNIQNGVDISDIIKQKQLEQPTLYTTALPSTGADISFKPAELNINYQPGTVNFDWQIKDPSFIYHPGSIQMKILEYPHIDIEYLGEPAYVPPSASPSYQEA